MANRKLTDEEFGAKLVAAYRAYRDLHEEGALDSDAEHPRDTVNDWINTVRDSKANDEGGLGPVEIQKRKASDDEQPAKTANGNSGSGGPMPAQDSYSIGVDGIARMFTRDGRILEGNDATEANARQSNPERVRTMAGAIKGYNRL